MMRDGGPAADHAALDLAPAADGWSFVRRKGHVGTAALITLIAAASLPFLLILCRSLALPGDAVSLPGFGFLGDLGRVLDRSFSLDWIPAHERAPILYLLLLPTGALLVVFTRLTLGVRILGFRAILIAMGFKASGIVPSLGLMSVVVATIIVIRPWLRRIHLPRFARVATIVCLSATIMILALLVAPWLRSDAIWGVAFFPVIIMAMLAEGIAKSLEQEDVVATAWRAGWTILLAFTIDGVDTLLVPFVVQFPELVLTELIAIVLVAEFLHVELLAEWPERLSRWVAGTRPWYDAKPKIAVVRNRDTQGVIGALGTPAPRKYRKHSVQRPVDALRAQGFQVKVLEGDMSLLKELAAFLPPHPGRGTPGGIALNLATGVQGEGRFSHVPAMLEMAGIPYTGPGPVAHAQLADRFALLSLLDRASIAVPGCKVVTSVSARVELEFPLSARPRFEPDVGRIVVRKRRRLAAAVREIRRHYAQPTVLEEIVRGRRIHASILGNGPIEILPLLESGRDLDARACPAQLDERLAERIRLCARRAYAAAGCRDYARIDIRLAASGEPVVVDVRWVDLFDRRGAFVTAAEAGGYTFNALMRRIVDVAAMRYLAGATARARHVVSTKDQKVVSIAERRAAAE